MAEGDIHAAADDGQVVRVQMTIVSAKTSNTYRPCWTGLLVSAAAWAMAAFPHGTDALDAAEEDADAPNDAEDEVQHTALSSGGGNASTASLSEPTMELACDMLPMPKE